MVRGAHNPGIKRGCRSFSKFLTRFVSFVRTPGEARSISEISSCFFWAETLAH